jgi:PRTRC genetic system protein E
MFQELMPVIKDRPLTITVASVAGGKVRVCVVPQSLEKDDKINEKAKHRSDVEKVPDSSIKALTTPLALTGTPEELDQELAGKLLSYAASHEQLQHGLAQAKEEINAAVQAIEDRKKNKPAGKTAPAPKDSGKDEKSPKKPEPPEPATLPLSWVAPAASATPTAVSASDAPAGDRDTHGKEKE